MPQHNFFTRATRIIRNAAQPAQSQNPQPNPTDSANHSQYETDGSSYEMLVVDTPPKSLHDLPNQQTSQPQQETQPTTHDPPPTPRRRQSTRRKPQPPTPRPERPSRHRQSTNSEKTQTEPQTPPRTPPPVPPEEPKTPSQRVATDHPSAHTTPPTVGQSSGYNLRSRTRSQAPPTPLRTPARSQRQRTPARTPARSRSRALRPAPSAHTTSGVAARPSNVSRRQIDESSVITLRAMCRNYGLPATGNKADLRERALKEFESRSVPEDQNQPLANEVKLPNDSIVARASGDGRRYSKRLNLENEENSGQVPQMTAHQHEQKEEEEDETGKQLTTSTVKPAGGSKQHLVEATVAAKSDEPSVHAKSDAPEKDPVQPRHPAECSIANSPAQPVVRRLEPKFAQPTVSSTGMEASSPESPRPPASRPPLRNTDLSVPFTSQNRQQAPTESVDARGGGLDAAAIFQELASGRRKLTQVEYETVLKSLKDKAPDRPPPLQVPINAAHVSLNTLPRIPFLTFKPPTVRSRPEEKGTSLSQKTPTAPQTHVAGSSNKPIPLIMPKSKPPTANALEKSDNNKRSIQNDSGSKPSSATTPRVQGAEPDIMELDKPATTNATHDDGDGKPNVPSVDNRSERGDEIKRTVQGERKLSQGSSMVDAVSNEDDKIVHSTPNLQPERNITNQTPLPTMFAGAEGGPREGNITNTREREHAPTREDAVYENGGHDEGFPLKSSKSTPRPSEVKRSGFATPRELVRRFNRFGEGHSAPEEDLNMKPEDNRDPAASLLRRNARRSSSGVPLFHSTRGPSTVGRSILKTRTASKARESQNRFPRMNRLYNLSGRSSFRVKRPVSASAGALLVDLRRISGSHRSSSELPGQRGSYQTEIARRPPPMPASALKILKELEQIQESNRSQLSRKRDVSPPPLPPSVVKRARRSGHFSQAASSSQGLSIFEQGVTGTQSKYPGGIQSDAKPGELLSSVGRPMPQIPVVAYGAGRKRGKRSRTGVDSQTFPFSDTPEEKNTVVQDVALRKDDKREGLSPPRPRKRQEQYENIIFGVNTRGTVNQSAEAAPQESALLVSFKNNAESEAARSTVADAERRDISFPVLEGSFSGKNSVEQPANLGSAAAAHETKAEAFNATKPFEAIGQHHNEYDLTVEPGQSLSGRPKFGEPLPKKTPFLPFFSTAGQSSQQLKRSSKSPDASTPFETRDKEAKAKLNEGGNVVSSPSTRAALTEPGSIALPAKESLETLSKQMDKPKGASQQKLNNVSSFQADTAHQVGNNNVQAPAFPPYAPPGASPFGASASAVPSSKAPLGTEGKEGDVTGVNAIGNEQPVLNKTASPFGSFMGTKGATGVVSAPSIPSGQGDSNEQNAFGVSLFAKPTQEQPSAEVEEKQKEEPSLPETDGFAVGRSETPRQSIPVDETASLPAGDFKAPSLIQEGVKTTTSDPGSMPRTSPDAAILPSLKPVFGTPQNKVVVPSSTGGTALGSAANASADTKPHAIPLDSGDMATATNLPSSKHENPDASSRTKDETPPTLSVTKPGLFSSGPFSEPPKEPIAQPTFSFSSAPQPVDGAASGPFSESKLNSAFSSANSSNMFAFGSSTEKDSTVKPAPSFSGLPDSATPDKEKQNPFTQITNPTPLAFGSQPPSGSEEVTKSSGPAFGLSSGSEAGVMFGQSKESTAPAFGGSFGSAPSIFNSGGTSNFPAGSSAPAFGVPATSPTAPLFGNVAIPSTPFGLPSVPAGATTTNNAASNMFGSASAGTSAPAFGGASVGSFPFANSNAGTFAANSTQQPNPFNQSGSAAPMSSGGAFAAGGAGGAGGVGGFNMGSAARGPPAPRRRLRGRRTLR